MGGLCLFKCNSKRRKVNQNILQENNKPLHSLEESMGLQWLQVRHVFYKVLTYF